MTTRLKQVCLILAGSAMLFMFQKGNAQITGSGTTSYVPKFTGTTAIGNSQIYDNATNVGVGFTSPSYKLDVNGDMNILSSGAYRIGGSSVFRIPGTANSCFGVNTSTAITGTANTLVGNSAGAVVSSGGSNSMMGYLAGLAHTSGNDAVYIGRSAGTSNTTGSNNTYIGAYSGRVGVSSNNNVIIGAQSGYNTTVSENVFVGFQAGYSSVDGLRNTFIGFQAGYSLNGFSNGHTFLGYKAGYTTNSSSSSNTFIGCYAGQLTTSGGFNTFLGHEAGQSNTTGGGNTFLGNGAGKLVTTGSSNILIGNGAGGIMTTESNNVLIGGSVSAGVNNAIAIGGSVTVQANGQAVIGSGSVTKFGLGTASTNLTNILEFGATTAKLTTGGTWTNASDRNIKENITVLKGEEVLEKINALDVPRWKYKNTEEYHIGPMAQDFYKLFQTGTDDKTISTIDPAGVALIGVKQLAKNAKEDAVIVKELTAENAVLKKQLDEITLRLTALENCVRTICEPVKTPSDNYSGLGGGALSQNTPNPFNQQTVIAYELPANVKQGQLQIAGSDGIVVKTIAITNPGKGEIIISAGSLAPGIYTYSLLIDGSRVESQKMVISK